MYFPASHSLVLHTETDDGFSPRRRYGPTRFEKLTEAIPQSEAWQVWLCAEESLCKRLWEEKSAFQRSADLSQLITESFR